MALGRHTRPPAENPALVGQRAGFATVLARRAHGKMAGLVSGSGWGAAWWDMVSWLLWVLEAIPQPIS